VLAGPALLYPIWGPWIRAGEIWQKLLCDCYIAVCCVLSCVTEGMWFVMLQEAKWAVLLHLGQCMVLLNFN
jgi:hypothetical protein